MEAQETHLADEYQQHMDRTILLHFANQLRLVLNYAPPSGPSGDPAPEGFKGKPWWEAWRLDFSLESSKGAEL